MDKFNQELLYHSDELIKLIHERQKFPSDEKYNIVLEELKNNLLEFEYSLYNHNKITKAQLLNLVLHYDVIEILNYDLMIAFRKLYKLIQQQNLLSS